MMEGVEEDFAELTAAAAAVVSRLFVELKRMGRAYGPAALSE